jgi:hypothetical protein
VYALGRGALSVILQPKEFERVASPDGKFDAIHLRSSGGAINPYFFQVRLGLHGSPSEPSIEVARGVEFSQLNITWLSDTKLLLKIRRADIYYFLSEPWQKPFKSAGVSVTLEVNE